MCSVSVLHHLLCHISHQTYITQLPNNSTSHDLLPFNFCTIFSVFLIVCLFVCLFVLFLYNIYCSCVIICTNSCALIFNSLLEGLYLVHTGVQQILIYDVHFMFYMFFVCVAVFRNASSMFNTESHVFVVLSIPFLIPVL